MPDPAPPTATFGLSHLLSWLTAGDAARPVPSGAPFGAVTMSSLPDGQPPMRPGGLFVAHVSRRDGHDFARDAFGHGARAALVGRIPENLRAAVAEGDVAVADFRPGAAASPAVDAASPRPLLLVVGHPLEALQGVAGWWRRRHGARVLAVAGAVGKTTTKELLANAVARRFVTLRTPGNFNNELGLPITLLGLTPAHQAAVLEIGISEVGEMATFAAVAGADVAVVTRIVPEHMEFLRDLDTVEREEGDLVAALPATGVAVLNAGDPRVARMASRTPAGVLRFGLPDEIAAPPAGEQGPRGARGGRLGGGRGRTRPGGSGVHPPRPGLSRRSPAGAPAAGRAPLRDRRARGGGRRLRRRLRLGRRGRGPAADAGDAAPGPPAPARGRHGARRRLQRQPGLGQSLPRRPGRPAGRRRAPAGRPGGHAGDGRRRSAGPPRGGGARPGPGGRADHGR